MFLLSLHYPHHLDEKVCLTRPHETRAGGVEHSFAVPTYQGKGRSENTTDTVGIPYCHPSHSHSLLPTLLTPHTHTLTPGSQTTTSYHHMVCQPIKAYAAKTSCEYQTSATRELSSKATTDPCTPMGLYTTTHFHTLAHSTLSILLSKVSQSPLTFLTPHPSPPHSSHPPLTLVPLTPHIHPSPLPPSPLTSIPHPSPLSPSPLTPTPHPSHPPLTPQIHPSPLTPHIHRSSLTSTPHFSHPPLTPHPCDSLLPARAHPCIRGWR